jgi:hypothetical protein
VIELEATEPCLYFGWCATAAGRCADAILARASAKQPASRTRGA